MNKYANTSQPKTEQTTQGYYRAPVEPNPHAVNYGEYASGYKAGAKQEK